jgi:hypothetical protein
VLLRGILALSTSNCPAGECEGCEERVTVVKSVVEDFVVWKVEKDVRDLSELLELWWKTSS